MSKLKKYVDYLDEQNDDVLEWINVILKNYLKKNDENQGEIEHIIDFLKSDQSPKRCYRMAYPEAKQASEKWVKTLQKKGQHIKETKDDVEVILDFGDGFKIVRLVGENAFKREGFLMSHCVASYAGSDKIYSLRDNANNPHATIEWGNQVKGRGNGSIHPKYVDYIVKFMENMDMPMRETDMINLGYLKLSDEQMKMVQNNYNDNLSLYKEEFLYVDDLRR